MRLDLWMRFFILDHERDMASWSLKSCGGVYICLSEMLPFPEILWDSKVRPGVHADFCMQVDEITGRAKTHSARMHEWIAEIHEQCSIRRIGIGCC